jgi:hypothetical protein
LLLDWKRPDEGVLTSKVFEYLFAKAPILAIGGSSSSAIGRLLEETRRGIHLACSAERISPALEALLQAADGLGSPGEAQALKAFSREHQSMRYLAYLKEAVRSVAREREERE